MSEAILRLDHDEVWTALEAMDPVGVLAEELIDRTVGNDTRRGELTAWTGPGAADADLVVLDHPDAELRCVLPAASLWTFTSAALAALAARELLVRGGVTVAMLGAGRATQPQLSVIARHVPDISHVAVYLGRSGAASLPVRVTDLLELSGIRLSVVPTAAEAVFGANLVVTADGGMPGDMSEQRIGRLARGTVLVNTTGRDLPAELADQVDEVYVDDLSLLAANQDRHFVSAHLAAPPTGTGVGHDGPRIAADLGQLLAGRRPARTHVDNVVLVELLSTHTLGARLAVRIQQAAVRGGLGTRVEP